MSLVRKMVWKWRGKQSCRRPEAIVDVVRIVMEKEVEGNVPQKLLRVDTSDIPAIEGKCYNLRRCSPRTAAG